MSSSGGWIGYGYKLTGELASELTVIEAMAYTVQHNYDVHGRRNLTVYPGGVVVSYGYDTASRVHAMARQSRPPWTGIGDRHGRNTH